MAPTSQLQQLNSHYKLGSTTEDTNAKGFIKDYNGHAGHQRLLPDLNYKVITDRRAFWIMCGYACASCAVGAGLWLSGTHIAGPIPENNDEMAQWIAETTVDVLQSVASLTEIISFAGGTLVADEIAPAVGGEPSS